MTSTYKILLFIDQFILVFLIKQLELRFVLAKKKKKTHLQTSDSAVNRPPARCDVLSP